MITTRYYWKKISDDGLLKPVEVMSGYGVLGKYGYTTEEEAVQDFYTVMKDDYCSADSIILVKCYGMSM